MAKALFLSETWLKQNVMLPQNLDPAKIYPFYTLCADKYIRTALGDALFNQLSDAIIANSISTDERTLLELIRPALAYFMVYESLPWIDTNVNNIGVVSTADEKQTIGTDNNKYRLRSDARNNAEFYLTRVKMYLCNNTSLFPNYNVSNDDINPSQGSSYRLPLHTDPLLGDPNIDKKWIKKFWG